ncbi:MAG TPA: YARHG domain-containing protein, partial [Puia sp.]|nr:YARHG domain-containing protein [Puia sp.]
SLDYVLTAAKRWANHRIDDFTLQIDAGEFQDLSIARTFFQHASEWTMSGVGKGLDWAAEKGEDKKTGRAEFFIRSGMLVFKKANFKPDGELHLNAVNSYFYYTKTLDKHTGDGPFKFDYRIDDLPYAIEGDNTLRDAVDELSNKIRRNLPFARRGYIFKSPEIQAYYARQPWYVPDSSYVPVVNQLTRKEQEMVNK